MSAHDITPADHAGWHSRGYLPHFDSPETVQHLIFRLADALPPAVVAAIHDMDVPKQANATGRALRRGYGARLLAAPTIASLVEAALLHFDGVRYRLLGWCVMPSHVHIIAEQIQGWPLAAVVHSWKSFTAKGANVRLSRTGAFWALDYYDRYMRDEAHFERTLAYVETNPVSAGLCATPRDWRFSSAYARFRIEYGSPEA